MRALNFNAAYPKGDQDQLFALGDALKHAAAELEKLEPSVKSTTDKVPQYYEGDGATAAAAEFAKLFDTNDVHSIPKLVETLNNLGHDARSTATDIEFAKIQSEIFALMTLYSVYTLIASQWGSLAVPALLAAARKGLAEFAAEMAQRIGDRMAMAALKDAAEPLARELAPIAEDAAEQAAKKAAQQVAKDAAEQATKKAADQAAKDAAEQAAKKATEDAAEQASKKAAEDAAEKTTEQAAKKAAEDATKKAPTWRGRLVQKWSPETYEKWEALNQTIAKSGARVRYPVAALKGFTHGTIMGTGLDAATQLGQIWEGHRDDGFNLKQTFQTGIQWGAGGITGGMAGEGLGRKLMNPQLAPSEQLLSKRMGGLVVGTGGGLAGAAGMYVAGIGTQASDHHWDFTKVDYVPSGQLIAGGLAMGAMGGGAHGLKAHAEEMQKLEALNSGGGQSGAGSPATAKVVSPQSFDAGHQKAPAEQIGQKPAGDTGQQNNGGHSNPPANGRASANGAANGAEQRANQANADGHRGGGDANRANAEGAKPAGDGANRSNAEGAKTPGDGAKPAESGARPLGAQERLSEANALKDGAGIKPAADASARGTGTPVGDQKSSFTAAERNTPAEVPAGRTPAVQPVTPPAEVRPLAPQSATPVTPHINDFAQARADVKPASDLTPGPSNEAPAPERTPTQTNTPSTPEVTPKGPDQKNDGGAPGRQPASDPTSRTDTLTDRTRPGDPNVRKDPNVRAADEIPKDGAEPYKNRDPADPAPDQFVGPILYTEPVAEAPRAAVPRTGEEGPRRNDQSRAAAAPVGDFRGDARPQEQANLTHDELLHEIGDNLDGILPERGPGEHPNVETPAVRWDPEGERFLVHDDLTGQDLEVTVEVGAVSRPDAVAEFAPKADESGYHITVSDRARTEDVARAISHELAEIRLERNPEIVRDPVTERPDQMTTHLGGRFAELKTLEFQIERAQADPARVAELPRLRQDMTDLLHELGMSGPERSETPWRLLEEHNPDLADRLANEHVRDPHPDSAEPSAPQSNPDPDSVPPHEIESQYGIPEQNQRKIQAYADEHDLIIEVRPTNPDAVPHLQAGDMPKPMFVKDKTINDLDVELGASPETKGLVGRFRPDQLSLPERGTVSEEHYAELENRLAERMKDYEAYQKKVSQLVDLGVLQIRPDGVVEGDLGEGWKPITGDHDLYDIRHADGSRLTPAELDFHEQNLIDEGLGVQHGPHVYWEPADEFQRSRNYEKIINQHQYDPTLTDKDREPLVRFRPQERPEITWAAKDLAGVDREMTPWHIERDLAEVHAQRVGSVDQLADAHFAENNPHATPAEREQFKNELRQQIDSDIADIRSRVDELANHPDFDHAAYRAWLDDTFRTPVELEIDGKMTPMMFIDRGATDPVVTPIDSPAHELADLRQSLRNEADSPAELHPADAPVAALSEEARSSGEQSPDVADHTESLDDSLPSFPDEGDVSSPLTTPQDVEGYLSEPHVSEALARADEKGLTITVDGVETPVSDVIRDRLPQHADLAEAIRNSPYMERSLLERPKSLASLLLHADEGVPILRDALDRVGARGPETCLADPVHIVETPRTPEQQAISDAVHESTREMSFEDERQPGFDKDRLDDLEYQREFLQRQYELWPETQTALNEVVTDIAGDTGKPGWRSEPKDEVRAWDKIREYGGEVSRLTDLVGAKIVYDNVSDAYRALEKIAADPRIEIVSFDDRFAQPVDSGYRDLQMKVRMPNGHIAELRVHLSHVDKIAIHEHAMYEVQRDLKALAKQEGDRKLSPEERALRHELQRHYNELFWEATEKGLPKDIGEEEGRRPGELGSDPNEREFHPAQDLPEDLVADRGPGLLREDAEPELRNRPGDRVESPEGSPARDPEPEPQESPTKSEKETEEHTSEPALESDERGTRSDSAEPVQPTEEAGGRPESPLTRQPETTSATEQPQQATNVGKDQPNEHVTRASENDGAPKDPDEPSPAATKQDPEAPQSDTAGPSEDSREMATHYKSNSRMDGGLITFDELSPKAKHLANSLAEAEHIPIRPGEVNVGHLTELQQYAGVEHAIVQNAKGELRLFRGERTRSQIPDDLSGKYLFVLHTHPEDRLPGPPSEEERRLRRTSTNSMRQDLLSKKTPHIEAVVSRDGQIRFFTNKGLLDVAPGEYPAGGPFNDRGFVVPVKGLDFHPDVDAPSPRNFSPDTPEEGKLQPTDADQTPGSGSTGQETPQGPGRIEDVRAITLDDGSLPEPHPVEASPDVVPHPAKLTPELRNNFEELRNSTKQVVEAFGDPARADELVRLRQEMATQFDGIGLRNPETESNAWRLFHEHDSKLADYLANYSRDLLPPAEEAHPQSHSEPKATDEHVAPDGASPRDLHETDAPSQSEETFRRFEDEGSGREYGESELGPIRDALPDDELESLRSYSRNSSVNDLLRAEDPQHELDRQLEAVSRRDALKEVFDGRYAPDGDKLQAHVNRTDLSEQQRAAIERNRKLLDEILNSPLRQSVLDSIWKDAHNYEKMQRELGGEPTLESIRDYVATIDRATSQTVPESIVVVRSVKTIDFMHGPDGELLGDRDPMQLKETVQTEEGFMSTTVGAKPTGSPRYVLELEIPEGTSAVWLGRESHYPYEDELLVGRRTPYAITDVIADPTGSNVAGAEYLIKAKLLPNARELGPLWADPIESQQHSSPVTEENRTPAESPHRAPESGTPKPDEQGERPLESTGEEPPTSTQSEPEPAEHTAQNTDNPVADMDRPTTLTPHLKGRFEELRGHISDVVTAHNDPARTAELPRLRVKVGDLVDKLGLRDQQNWETPWRLFDEHDAALAKYLQQNHEHLLPSREDLTAVHSEPDSQVIPSHELSEEPHTDEPAESHAPESNDDHPKDEPNPTDPDPQSHNEIPDLEYTPELTHDEKAAVYRYTDPEADVFSDLNHRLRNSIELDPAQQTLAADIASGLDKLPAYDGTVWRGTHLTPEQLARYVPGAKVTEASFTSSSRDPRRIFTSNVEFIVHSETGRDVSAISARPGEREVLFKPDTTFEVRGVVHDPDAGLFGKTRVFLYESAEHAPVNERPSDQTGHEDVPGDDGSAGPDAHAAAELPVRHAPDRTALGDSPAVQRVFDNVRNEGEHDVIVHGDRFGKPTADSGHEIDPQHVVDSIRNNPDYVEGTPIRLLSCHSGNDIGWAQHIANELGVPVRAPSDLVGVRAVPDSPATIHNDAEWRTFHPAEADGTTPEPTIHKPTDQTDGPLPRFEEDPRENWDVLGDEKPGDETAPRPDPTADEEPAANGVPSDPSGHLTDDGNGEHGYPRATLDDLGFPDGEGIAAIDLPGIEQALAVTELVPTEEVRFTQRSVSRTTSDGLTIQSLADHMADGGWRGGPIHAVIAEDGRIISLDNRRLTAAQMAGLDHVPTALHSPHDPLEEWPHEWDAGRRERNYLRVDIRELPDGTLRVGGDEGRIAYPRGTVAETWGDIALFRAAEQRSLLPGDLGGSDQRPVFAGKPAPSIVIDLPEADHQAIADAVRAARPDSDQILSDIRATLDTVNRDLGLALDTVETRGEDHRVKSEESLARKFQAERKPGETIDGFLSRVNDLVRFSTRMPDGDGYRPALDAVLSKLEDRGYEVIDIKNFWKEDNRYLGLNTTLRSPHGREFELQFPTDTGWRANKLTHEPYEVFRRANEPNAEPIERRVHAFLQILHTNEEIGLGHRIPSDVDKRWSPTDSSLAKWVRKNPDQWRLYENWLHENNRNLRWVTDQFGLDLDKHLPGYKPEMSLENTAPIRVPRDEENGPSRPRRRRPDGENHQPKEHETDSAAAAQTQLPEHLKQVFDRGVDIAGGRAYYTVADDMLPIVELAKPNRGFYTIDMHGDRNSVSFGTSSFSPSEAAMLIRADPNWKNQPVWLNSCETGKGKNPFAQQLADELGVKVVGPTELVWAQSDGTSVVATAMYPGTKREMAKFPPDGKWKPFKPTQRKGQNT